MMSKHLAIFFTSWWVIFGLCAQTQKVKNQPYVDQRWYHFGFSVGLHSQDLLINNTGYRGENGEVWFCEIPSYAAGFSVSLISDMYLNPYMNLRFTPTMHFGDKNFTFREEASGAIFKAPIRSNYLTLPLTVKFGSLRINNYRPFLLGGVYGAWDVGRQKDQATLMKALDYGLEFGFGCDFYLPIIKVCPEIKFCFGLANWIEQNRSDLRNKELMKYTQAISGGTSRMVVISISFE
jgi:hypothetical protein